MKLGARRLPSVGTDLVDRGYGFGGVDFLQVASRPADALVTNPPFGKLVTAFIKHALNLDVPYIAMLLNGGPQKAAKVMIRKRPHHHDPYGAFSEGAKVL